MARYPTFEEYQQKGAYRDGIKRCNDLLNKQPKDVRLLITKLRLLLAIDSDEAQQVLEQLIALVPPVQDAHDLITIEEAIVVSRLNGLSERRTAGTSVTKLWENAIKATASLSQRVELASIRFERAILDNRILDAQQSLIQLKASQPKNRIVYMAHAAYTQLLSASKEDMHARLAIRLARKAVTEKFDEDQALDCRIPGQIFVRQNSKDDLGGIVGRRFAESKQVFEATRDKKEGSSNGVTESVAPIDPQGVPTRQWLTAEITSLKQSFAALIENSASADVVEQFALNALHIFGLSIRQLASQARRSAADTCFLAISAFVRLWEVSQESQYLLHALLLIRLLLDYDPHVHEARIMSIYLHMRLGVGGQAIRMFHSLNVKEIQYDTVSHILFARIALLHPNEAKWTKKEGMDPWQTAGHALSVYSRCEDKLAETEANVLSHGQTGMIFDLQELRGNLRDSLSKRVLLLERRRITRSTHQTAEDKFDVSELGPPVTDTWFHTTDNRDFAVAFNYGYNVERVLHGHRGVVPGTSWLLCNLVADTTWCISNSKTPLITDPMTLLRKTQILLNNELTDTDGSSIPAGMAPAEILAGNVAVALLAMLLRAQDNSNSPAAETPDYATLVRHVLEAIEALNVNLLVATVDPLADRLMDHYVYADILNIVAVAAKFCLGLEKATKGETAVVLEELQEKSKRLRAALLQHAKEQQARVKASGVLQLMTEDKAIWDALDKLAGDSIRSFAENTAAGAAAGWKGLI